MHRGRYAANVGELRAVVARERDRHAQLTKFRHQNLLSTCKRSRFVQLRELHLLSSVAPSFICNDLPIAKRVIVVN